MRQILVQEDFSPPACLSLGPMAITGELKEGGATEQTAACFTPPALRVADNILLSTSDGTARLPETRMSHVLVVRITPNSSPLRKEHLFLCSFAGHSWPIPVCLLVHFVNTESKDCSKKRQTGQSINAFLPSTDAASNCS